MKRFLTVSTLMFFFLTSSFAQSVDEIKGDRRTWLWGEGSGSTLNKAHQQALEMILNQISVEVESKFSLLKQENSGTGGAQFKEECKEIVTTYSAATLTGTESLVLATEPQFVVFRYLRRSEVVKIFEQRKEKILDFTLNAGKALGNLQIADALRYYYWALTLLRSHPDGDALRYQPAGETARLLTSWLPEQINRIFDGLEFSVTGVRDEGGSRIVTLSVKYNGQPVENLDYDYWDGRNFSAPVSAKDGLGFLEFFGDPANPREETQIRAEYIFAGEARIDRELETVLERLEPIPFRKNLYPVRFHEKKTTPSRPDKKPVVTTATMQSASPTALGTVKNIPSTEITQYQKMMEEVLQAIRDRQYEGVKGRFTPEGYEVFTRLIMYGQARVLSMDTLSAIRLHQTTLCRGARMSFSFRNNNRKFVEEVVFHFNPDQKIETLSFGLNEKALGSILSNDNWNVTERLTLVNFLEHYKTAYALKRLDYISSIFADDALIITGSMVKVKPGVENPFAGNAIVKYNRYNKEQYLRALEHTFAGNEFINLEFEESAVRKGGVTGDLYGIQIKQNYYSATYGDQGYLFLLIDFKSPDEPLIHVRTWQPQREKDGTIYGIEDF